MSPINRTKDINGSWAYEDAQTAELALYVSWKYDLESIDNFIEGEQEVKPNASAIADLMGRRSAVLSAFKAGNNSLAMERMETLFLACRLHGITPKAIVGDAVFKGRKSRDDMVDKPDFIGIVCQLDKRLVDKPRTLSDWLALPDLSPYKVKYRGHNTLRGWFNEALPGRLRSGRPKKHTV